MHRYEHFWHTSTVAGSMAMQKDFHNPFNKGSAYANCMDMFVYRRRFEKGTTKYVPVPQEEMIGLADSAR